MDNFFSRVIQRGFDKLAVIPVDEPTNDVKDQVSVYDTICSLNQH